MTQSQAKEPRKSVLLMCRRSVILTGPGNKVGRVFLEMTEGQFDIGALPGDEAERTYEASRKEFTGKAHVGQVYRVDMTEDGKSIYPSSARFHGVWKDTISVAAWQTAERNFEARRANEKAAKEEGKDAVAEACEDLLAIARKMPFGLRGQLIARVTQLIATA